MFDLVVDLVGISAFAISGVITAMEKRLNLFGIFIIAFVTAVGGGTLRDVLIVNTSVFWMTAPIYIVIIFSAVLVAIFFVNQLRYLRKSLFLFDAIGVGLYTLVGIEKGIAEGYSPIVCIVLGTITASFGGVIRDILCNEIPILFRKEIYATICVLGGVLYFILMQFPMANSYAYISSVLFIILIRLLAMRFRIALPNIYKWRGF